AGYEISQVLHTNGTVSQTLIANDTVSGTIDAPNVRYYNQFTNTLKSVKVKVTILKTNQDGAKPLPGAVFDLYDAAGYAKEPKEALQSGLVSSSEEGKVGTIELGALSDGVYYLVETHAPAGYNQLTTPVVITVSNGDVSYSQDNTSLDDTGAGKSGDFENGYVLKVVNDAGVELPMTGGMGVWRLMALGLLLTLGAGAALMRRRDERP
ncbi:MAG: LPXTG cell wall anchor domain-containing protein, partial [Ruminococcaceae bacterium]|nr:LPXTG cell wall anchor domain-containing protein [Oscillospiraceae bacterium]